MQNTEQVPVTEPQAHAQEGDHQDVSQQNTDVETKEDPSNDQNPQDPSLVGNVLESNAPSNLLVPGGPNTIPDQSRSHVSVAGSQRGVSPQRKPRLKVNVAGPHQGLGLQHQPNLSSNLSAATGHQQGFGPQHGETNPFLSDPSSNSFFSQSLQQQRNPPAQTSQRRRISSAPVFQQIGNPPAADQLSAWGQPETAYWIPQRPTQSYQQEADPNTQFYENQGRRNHPPLPRNEVLGKDALDYQTFTPSTWKEAKEIREYHNPEEVDQGNFKEADFVEDYRRLSTGRIPYRDLATGFYSKLVKRDSEQSYYDPLNFFLNVDANYDRRLLQPKKLADPGQQLSALKNKGLERMVTMAPATFPPWKIYADTILNASYLGAMTLIKHQDVPVSPKEWDLLDERPETVGAFYWAWQNLSNGIIPSYSDKDDIFILNGIFKAVCKYFPSTLLILQPMLSRSLDPLFSYLTKVPVTQSNFRVIYFTIVKKFRGVTEKVIAMRIQKFLKSVYDPRNGPAAFATKLQRDRLEINDLSGHESLSMSMLRMTFIEGIRAKTQLFNHLLDASTIASNLPLDEVIDILEKKYLEERLSQPLQQGFEVKSFGSKPKSKPIVCYQWRDLGSCSFGKECKWKEFHTEANKGIGESSNRGKTFLAAERNGDQNDEDDENSFAEQFVELANLAKSKKKDVNKYKKKFKAMANKANLLTKELNRRNKKSSMKDALNRAAKGNLTVDEAADMADNGQANIAVESLVLDTDCSSESESE